MDVDIAIELALGRVFDSDREGLGLFLLQAELAEGRKPGSLLLFRRAEQSFGRLQFLRVARHTDE